MKEFLNGRVALHPGDCRASVAALPEASIDSVVTDPPYSLVSIVKRFGKEGAAEAKSNGASGVYKRASSGFMGKQWDTGEVAFDPEFWASVLRVLKPGGHLVAFSGTRTYHRMACAIEDAGFEIRDMIGWLYGSGFPKSHCPGDKIDRHLWDEDEWERGERSHRSAYYEGHGTALKPAQEPICLARKPLIGTVAENVLAHGTGAINIDACRVATDENLNGGAYAASGGRASLSGDEREGAAAGMFQPGKTADKGYVQPSGRWPANLVHDGSEEVLAAFPETGISSGGKGAASQKTALAGHVYGDYSGATLGQNAGGLGDSGSAARFFYSAKADSDDRIGSKHPTVKPVDLKRYLCRLITPPGGTILDPFAGTGTTGEAAFYEGFRAILCEREAEYIADIERRMSLVMAGPRERRAAAKKQDDDLGPLFR